MRNRYWAITSPLRYRTSVNKRRLFVSICVIWLNSAAISFIPIFSGLYHDGSVHEIFSMAAQPDCSLKVNPVYATVSSLISFYLPLPIMFYVYLRILLIAERQSREIKQLQQSLKLNGYPGGGGSGNGGAITKTMASFGPTHELPSTVSNVDNGERSTVGQSAHRSGHVNGASSTACKAHHHGLTSTEQLICKNTTSEISSQPHLAQLRPITAQVPNHSGQRSSSFGGCVCSIVIQDQLGPSSLSSAEHLRVCCTSSSCFTLGPLDRASHRKCSDSSTTSGSCSSAAIRCSLQVGLHGSSGLASALLGVHAPITGSFEGVFADPASNSTTGSAVCGTGSTCQRPPTATVPAPSVLDELRRAERQLRKRSKQILTDTKAIRTLGIVMGVFVACWLPFFIMYVLNAYAEHLQFSYEVRSAITWLGYFNSSFNPCIYALLNKEFQLAFRRVLHCAPRILVHGVSRRPGEEASVLGTNRPFGTQTGTAILPDFNSASVGGLNSHGLMPSGPTGATTSKRTLSPFGFKGRRARFLGRALKGGGSGSRHQGSGCIMRELSSSGASHSCTKDLYDSLEGTNPEWPSLRADSIGDDSLAGHITLDANSASFRPEVNHCNGHGTNDTKNVATTLQMISGSSQHDVHPSSSKAVEKADSSKDDELWKGRAIGASDKTRAGRSYFFALKHTNTSKRSNGRSRGTKAVVEEDEEDLPEVDEDGPTAQHVAADLAIELQLPSSDLALRNAAVDSGHKSKADKRRQKIANQTRLGVRLARFLDPGRLNRRRNRLPVSSSTKRKRSDAKLIAI
jgi:hypothetical protein